ncbi:hypothetical protein [Nakamurella leprariae]|uniref:Uncharacterized protein n=1 Tax=Nakamurella leprariae TaxID=2803911 RepID=A0A938Y739_9ACTN|nr:hypothetical protein [Nakamurella leprariae]MBM9467025.1 hypothetical protein [Nakamurella leprariae]
MDSRPGRRTHRHDGPLVLFLVGMGINRPPVSAAYGVLPVAGHRNTAAQRLATAAR